MKDLQKEFVPYEFALRMKQLEYDEPCIAEYVTFKIPELNAVKQNSSGQIGFNTKTNSQRKKNTWDKDGKDAYVSAPTFSQAFRFFRQEYGLHHVIHQLNFKKGTDEEYLAEVDKKDGFSYFRTYEECEYYCLEKLIEVVEEKQK